MTTNTTAGRIVTPAAGSVDSDRHQVERRTVIARARTVIGSAVQVYGAATVHSAPACDGAMAEGARSWRILELALNLYPTGRWVESFWPTDPTSTRVECTSSFLPGTPSKVAERAVASSLAILDEDRGICEAIERCLASGLARPGVLGPRHEAGMALVPRLVIDAVDGT